MCGNSKSCVWGAIAKWLVIIGGINWGAMGLGMLLGKEDAWNLVRMFLGNMPTVEAIIYALVGLAALLAIFGCKCKSCTCAVEEKKEGVGM